MFETEALVPSASSNNSTSSVGNTGGGVDDGGGGTKLPVKSPDNTLNSNGFIPSSETSSSVQNEGTVSNGAEIHSQETCENGLLAIDALKTVVEGNEAQDSKVVVDQNKEAVDCLGIPLTNGVDKVIEETICLTMRSSNTTSTSEDNHGNEEQVTDLVSATLMSSNVSVSEETIELQVKPEKAQEEAMKIKADETSFKIQSPTSIKDRIANGLLGASVDGSSEDKKEETTQNNCPDDRVCQEHSIMNSVNGQNRSDPLPGQPDAAPVHSNGFVPSLLEKEIISKVVPNGHVKADAVLNLSEKCLQLLSLIKFLPGEKSPYTEEIIDGIIVLTNYRLIIITRRRSNSKVINSKPNNIHNDLLDNNSLSTDDRLEVNPGADTSFSGSCDDDEEDENSAVNEEVDTRERQTNGANTCQEVASAQEADITTDTNNQSQETLPLDLPHNSLKKDTQEESMKSLSEVTSASSLFPDATNTLLKTDTLNQSSLTSEESDIIPNCSQDQGDEKETKSNDQESSSTSTATSSPATPEIKEGEEETEGTEEVEKIFLPIGSIDSLEIRDNHQLHLLTKHVKCFICLCTSSESCSTWFKRINDAITYQSKIENLFCFKFWQSCLSRKLTTHSSSSNDRVLDSSSSLTSSCHQKSSSSFSQSCHSMSNKSCLFQDSFKSNGSSGDPEVQEKLSSHDSNNSLTITSGQGSSFKKEVEAVSTVNEEEKASDDRETLLMVFMELCLVSNQPLSTSLHQESNGFVRKDFISKGLASHKDVFEETMFFEFERMEFASPSGSTESHSWRMTDMNHDYKAFPTYPSHLIVPNAVSDEELSQVASFRAFRRIPAVVWRNRETGCVISRSSQPEVGWFGWRSGFDEKMISEIITSSSASKLLILDARSYAAAVANRAKGGGCECNEYYPLAEVQFMGLANIHSIRKSFQSIRYLCQFPSSDPSNWSNQIDSSRWLHHISGLIKSSLLVVNAVGVEGKSVLVHCSDGWDRTPQITALSQLLLDPFYRSTKGFLLLIQKEWLEFGHKFYDRGGVIDDPNERCPVFLQWMDCVHQIVQQFPKAFEFNRRLLIEVVLHVHSGLFGNFTCNNMSERMTYHVSERSFSLWSSLTSISDRFKNDVYHPTQEHLSPSYRVSDMIFWNEVYLKNTHSILDE